MGGVIHQLALSFAVVGYVFIHVVAQQTPPDPATEVGKLPLCAVSKMFPYDPEHR
jgi:hypothetical protein